MNIYADSAHTFATRPEQAVDAERHAATRTAVALLKDGKPGRAHWVLQRSLLRQARMAGIRVHTDGAA